MKIKNVTDPEFRRYGRIVDGYDFTEMIKVMEQTPLPEEVIYVPSDNKLEKTEPVIDLKMRIFGELPIQIGYCNGHNSKLNALEYHRSSEVNVAVTDIILLLGSEQDIASDFRPWDIFRKTLQWPPKIRRRGSPYSSPDETCSCHPHPAALSRG